MDLKKKRLIEEAWKQRTIYVMTNLPPILHFLYILKYVICVLLGRYCQEGRGELIWMAPFYPVYTIMFDPPEPAWDEHYVGQGFLKNWFYSATFGLR